MTQVIEPIVCGCGCGQTFTPNPFSRYKPVRFIKGHQFKTEEHRQKMAARRIASRTPEGKFCACGCGETIELNASNRIRQVRFKPNHSGRAGLSRGRVVSQLRITDPVPCACGCGGFVSPRFEEGPIKGKPRYIRNPEGAFIHGHNMKGRPNLKGRGPLSPRWKGGRTIVGGYVHILMPEHPRAKKTGYMLEHRIVMERMLGRFLEPWEEVHHKNGVKTDNSPENLELWKHSQPSGVRQSDYHCHGCRCFETVHIAN